MRTLRLSVAALLILLGGSLAIAQEIYGTLVGSVTDATGAVVPGASVLVHSNDTNTDVRTVTADGSGNFTVTNLPAGTYTVTVKNAGFRSYSASNVIIHVAEKRTLDVQLQPGQVTETVNVTETAVPVQTTSAAQAATITGTQVRELQLNNRNFEQLVTLQPGVTSQLPDIVGFGLNNATTISVNGARPTANNWTVDGADINDSGSNGTLLNVPSIDAIQEFTLGRSNYDAQYGRSGGGQVLVGTKSGTSQFHGDAYEFVRNDILDANSFFSNLVGAKKPPLRYNDFGFTIGGPLFVPKLYKKSESKTFFFWSEEWRKTGNPSTNTAVVPTTAQLAGTFTGVVNPGLAPANCVTYNAATNTSQISPSCFSKRAVAYISNIYSKFPANAGNGTQFINNTVAKQNYRQDLVRLDQNITDKIHIFGRFMQDVVPTTEPLGLFASPNALPGVFSTATNAPGKNVVANMSWAISPTVVNEAAFNYSWGAINSNLTGITNSPAFFSAVGTGLPFTDPYGRVPTVSITGINSVFAPSAPYFERNIDKNFYDNFSKVIGNHTVRAGITVQWMRKTENGPVGPGGFSFGTLFGNPAFANFLLGNASSFSQSSPDTIPNLNYLNIEGYVQDDWKVTPRFTLNFGLRYSYFPAPADANNTLVNFDPALFNAAAVPLINGAGTLSGGNFVAGQALTPTNYVNGLIFPAGTACANAQKLVSNAACSPFGSIVNPNSNNNFGPRFGFAWDVLGNGKTAVRGGYGVYYDRSLNGIWEQNAFNDPPRVQQVNIPNTTFDNPTAGAATTRLNPFNLTVTGNPTFKVPSYQDYNFSVEQQIHTNTVLQVAYVATLGRHLLGDIDLNQVPVATRLANPTVALNALRPYLGYGTITSRDPIFISNYNSLQVSLNRRVSNGLTLGISYTWSKNLATNPGDRATSIADTYNSHLDYGPPTLNTPHVFIANYVYDLPFFKDQKGVIGHVLGGWEWSGVTTLDSGQSQTIRQSNDPFNSFDYAAGTPNVYPGGIGIDPSTVPPRADFVLGQSVTGPGTRFEYFNTNAFTDAIGHFGTAGRGIILSPGIENWDMAGIRNFKFGERASLQFRGEFFNAFNHTNFNGLGLNVDTPSTYGKLTGITQSTHNTARPEVVFLDLVEQFSIRGTSLCAACLFLFLACTGALNAQNKNLQSLLVEGSQALQRGENAAAEKSFRDALAIEPRSIEILNDLAISLARQGKQAEAIPFYEQALKIAPGDLATTKNLAIAYFREQHYQQAWPLLKQLTSKSADFQTLDLAGLTLFALDRYPESAEYLERASKLNPSDLPTLDMLGKAYLRAANYQGATNVFAQIMAVDPNSPEAHVMMGMAYDKLSRDDDARSEFEAARKANPRFPGVHSGLGQVYWKEGKVDLAAAEFEAELKNYPDDPVSNCLLGEVLLKQNGAAAAAPHFRAATLGNPNYKEAFFGLGKAELALDHPKEAVAPLRKAVELDADYVQAHYALGTALRKLGQTAEASKELALAEKIQARQRAEYSKKLNSESHQQEFN